MSEGRNDDEVRRELTQRTRRSFTVGAVAAGVGGAGLLAICEAGMDSGLPWPLRKALEWNAAVSRALGDPSRPVPTFNRRLAREPRPNGNVGLGTPVEVKTWSMSLTGLSGRTQTIRLADVLEMPRVECVAEFKCVEGWSTIVGWAGVPLRAFLDRFLGDDVGEHLGLATPGGEYYVALEKGAFRHPQTLLCHEMNGEPLTQEHGAPLRLAAPMKYGIKSLKRIGSIVASAKPAPDYWAERGYDRYAGH